MSLPPSSERNCATSDAEATLVLWAPTAFNASASCAVSGSASDALSSSQDPASICGTSGSSPRSHSMVNNRSSNTRFARSCSEIPAASRNPSTVKSTVPAWSNTSRSASHSPARDDDVTRARQ
ncbi:Uncharacterised protein [Mycobacterium tuberculosis]|uniref:Uncharacterized protein n=1 Tax=Mycobacterium tuberculosis TaxID=1773 RepID=A0A0U0UG03_MYCTX|nr:Uncharacterised protein [Mycobacterium tuberculosis]COV67853.1 Uncharacterised protein [Mycobacterium tuberculosis]COZ57569.1 Uncharacterised protein [Mycobacterium tuberculosis]